MNSALECLTFMRKFFLNCCQYFNHPYFFDLVHVCIVQHLPCRWACRSPFQLDLDELWSKRAFRTRTPTLDVERDTTDNKSGCSNGQQSNNSIDFLTYIIGKLIEIHFSNMILNFNDFLNPTQDLEVMSFSTSGHLYIFVSLNE